jgi:cytochrome c oxidase assembly factor CtaG
MSTRIFMMTAWSWSPGLFLGCAAAVVGFCLLSRKAGGRGRPGLFALGLALVFLTLASPLNVLAEGCLFSAHMLQHLTLLFIAPAFFLLSLPRGIRAPAQLHGGGWLVAAWIGGVGAMWFWHVPAFCDAASASHAMHGFQTISLLSMGLLFWWPIFAPGSADRIAPWAGVAYLFTACLACTALGILITLTPVEVCPIFREPADPFGFLPTIRNSWGLSAERDREIGGLLMWVPMCAIYVGAIVVEIARWYGAVAGKHLEGAAS